MALLLALARNIPQAYVSLTARQMGALEVLGGRALREDARHPRLRADRPAGRAARPRLRHARARLRPVRERRALPRAGRREGRQPDDVYAPGRLHHDPPAQDRPRPRASSSAEAFATMRDGVRVLNVARGGLIDEAALARGARLGQGRGRGARRLPQRADDREPAVRRSRTSSSRPHLGASTAEATDRAGYQSAEQVVAALTGGVVSTRRQHPRDRRPRTWRCSGPFLPLATQLGPAGDEPRRGQLGGAHRGGLPRAHRRLRHPPARARRDRGRAAGPHRGAGQPRQRADDGRSSAGSSSRRRPSPRPRTSTS